MGGPAVALQPIRAEDAGAVGAFLNQHLNAGVTAEAWSDVIRPPWKSDAPNHGFQLVGEEGIVGVYAAVYSTRGVEGAPVAVCNLAAFCVLESHRSQSLRLIRALLGQKGFDFTDLSPSGNVVAMNERLGFTRLDTATKLAVNLPGSSGRRTTVTSDPAALETTLRGQDAAIYRDHRDAAAANHLLIERGGVYAYLVFRKDRRKRVPVFATPLYAGGDHALLEASWAGVASHLLLHHGMLATLAERRVLGFTPKAPGRELRNPRPKMFRGSRLDPATVDYLYSELVLVRW
ncbi:MAG TPA: hypothetical protein VNT50_07590 [Microbacterium sp.]|uniref:hypothetical protein n=1 Tax=Microbacterium sp. TaxID=51671 RepID=UPI002B912EA4|nr:hypothetical protein [Microbacterium sp.]HWI31338.1 hypothetical protein [Microbacterium sp.]